MKKIAICLTGQARVPLNLILYPFKINIIENLQVDYDIFSVSNKFIDFKKYGLNITKYKFDRDLNKSEINSIIKNTKYTHKIGKETKDFSHHSKWGFLMQIKSIYDCYELVEEYSKHKGVNYLYAMRIRLDARFFHTLNPSIWNFIDKGYGITPKGSEFDGINDRFFLGSFSDFEKYATIYKDFINSEGIWKKNTNYDRSEIAFKINLSLKKVKVKSFYIPFCLVSYSHQCLKCRKKEEIELLKLWEVKNFLPEYCFSKCSNKKIIEPVITKKNIFDILNYCSFKVSEIERFNSKSVLLKDFLIKKFDKIYNKLPHNSLLQKETCTVVGKGPQIDEKNRTKFVDSNDLVIRTNGWYPKKGNTGTKTDIIVYNRHMFLKTNKKKVIDVYNIITPSDYNIYIKNDIFKYLINPEFVVFAQKLLSEKYYVTHGFLSVLLSLTICKRITLIGFSKNKKYSKLFGSKQIWDGHNLSSEYKIYEKIIDSSFKLPNIFGFKSLNTIEYLENKSEIKKCDISHERYTNVEKICPPDRHLVESIYHDENCPPPSLRNCITRNNINDWKNYEIATKTRNITLRSMKDAVIAAKTGKVPGLFEPADGAPWAYPEFDKKTSEIRQNNRVKIMKNFVNFSKLNTAIDIGGGTGRFCSRLKHENILCITLSKDNYHNSNKNHYFDLPLNKIGVDDGLLMLTWSGKQRLPFPNNQFDIIHSAYAIENFSEDPNVVKKIFYDWDRVLRINGVVVIEGSCNLFFNLCGLLDSVSLELGWKQKCFKCKGSNIIIYEKKY